MLALDDQRRREGVEVQQRCAGRGGPGGDDGRRAAVGEQRAAEQGVGVLGAAQVQRAQLDGDDEDHRVGVGPAEVRGRPQGRERAVAAHEADVVALHGGLQAQRPDHLDVGAGGVEAGAGDGDDVGDVGGQHAGRGGQRLLGGGGEQLTGRLPVDGVAAAGRQPAQHAGGGVEEPRAGGAAPASSARTVWRVSMAAASKTVATIRCRSRDSPGWAAKRSRTAGWARTVSGTTVSMDRMLTGTAPLCLVTQPPAARRSRRSAAPQDVRSRRPAAHGSPRSTSSTRRAGSSREASRRQT